MPDSLHKSSAIPDVTHDAGPTGSLPPLLRVLPDAIFRMRRDGTYLDCSIPEGTPTIVPAAKFLGRRAAEVLPEPHAAMCMSALETACRTTTPQQFEYSMGREPSPRHYEVRVIPISDDEALVIVRNISDRKQEEAEARRWGQKLALYFRQTAVGVIEWDAAKRVVEWNPGAQRIFGYTRQQAIGRHAAELVVPPESLAHVNQIWNEILTGRGGTRSDNENMTADGRRIFCEWFNTPLADEQGDVIGVASLVQDATDRTVAQRELQRSREQHAQLVNTIEGIVWEADPKTRRFTFMSKQVEWILGVPAAKWLGDSPMWESRVYPDDLVRVREYSASFIALRQDHQYEFRIYDADGSVVWLRNYVTVVSETDEPVMLRGIMVDVTTIKNAEAALERSREQLEQAQSVAHVGSWIWEAGEKSRLVWSRETFRIFGVQEAGFDERLESFSRLVHPDDLPKLQRASEAALQGGPRYSIDHRIIRPDGTMRWVHEEADIVWNPDGTPCKMIGVVQDITDGRRTMEALRASEARFRRVVESNLIGLFFWEPRGQIIEANDAFLDMLGYRQGNVASGRLNWRELTPPEFCQSDENALAELRRGGHCKPYAKEFIRSDGARIPVLIGAAWLDDSRQQGVAYVLDITERKRAEQWQALMMAELDHRVKNNMAAVLTLTEQTLRSMQHPREQATSLLGRLRALARAHGALATTHWQGARLLPLVQRTLEAFRHSEVANIVIEGEDVLLPPRVATVLSMALHELGTNALKYGALLVPEGVVYITWACRIMPDSKRVLRMRWIESNGPRVEAPTRRGFGRELIEGGIRFECAGTVNMHFDPTGITCEFEIPLSDPEMPPVIVKPGMLPPMRL